MADTDADRAEIRRLEQEWMEAHQRRDGDRLEELVADGFRFTAIHLNPEPMTREQWMDAALGGYLITSFSFESMDVDVFGDTAVGPLALLADRLLHRRPLERLPASRTSGRAATGRWQVVARHTSILG